mmetsp:Transcript_9669/g.29009  ORF Transcript_9669/g.29009 Transcript_9669/m.29009 type:complete len:255 (+) Transcript_9669:1167-1931(+)
MADVHPAHAGRLADRRGGPPHRGAGLRLGRRARLPRHARAPRADDVRAAAREAVGRARPGQPQGAVRAQDAQGLRLHGRLGRAVQLGRPGDWAVALGRPGGRAVALPRPAVGRADARGRRRAAVGAAPVADDSGWEPADAAAGLRAGAQREDAAALVGRGARRDEPALHDAPAAVVLRGLRRRDDGRARGGAARARVGAGSRDEVRLTTATSATTPTTATPTDTPTTATLRGMLDVRRRRPPRGKRRRRLFSCV